MKYENYLTEIMKMFKKEPERLFDSSIEDFTKDLKAFNEEYVKKRSAILKAEIEKAPDEPTRMKLQDAYDNSMLLIGESDTMAHFDSFNMNGMLYNFYLWNAFYVSSWAFAKVIDKTSSDMIKNGWKLKVDMKPTYRIDKQNKRYKIKPIAFNHSEFRKKQSMVINDIVNATKWMLMYGGGVVCLLHTDADGNPYDPSTELIEIKQDDKLKFLVADRWQGVMGSPNNVEDIGSEDFNTPVSYYVTTGAGKTYKFHHSRVARFSNGVPPELIKRMLMGWGIPIGIRLYNEITRDEKSRNMITSLLSKYNLEIVKSSGMKAYMTGRLTPQMEANLDRKLEMINRYRHFNSMMFLDKDDEYQRLDSSNLGSLYQILDSQSRQVAGAANMPQVLLYGDQQDGLSGNTFDDLRLWEDHLMSERNAKLRPAINKISKWLLMWMQVDYYDYEIIFNSSLPKTVDERTDESRAVIELYRQLKDLGIYDNYMIAKELYNNDDLIIGGELTEDYVESLKGKSPEVEGEEPEDGEPGATGSGGEFNPNEVELPEVEGEDALVTPPGQEQAGVDIDE